MTDDDDKRCANRLRANANKFLILAHELDTFASRPDSDFTKRRAVLRQVLEHTRGELLELIGEDDAAPKGGDDSKDAAKWRKVEALLETYPPNFCRCHDCGQSDELVSLIVELHED